MLTNFINSLAIILSLSTATGIFVHDTKLDKTVSVFSLPPAIANTSSSASKVQLGGALHTHTERISLAQVIHDLKNQNPRIQPRGDDKKHLLQKRVMKGHHAFDNYSLPIV